MGKLFNLATGEQVELEDCVVNNDELEQPGLFTYLNSIKPNDIKYISGVDPFDGIELDIEKDIPYIKSLDSLDVEEIPEDINPVEFINKDLDNTPDDGSDKILLEAQYLQSMPIELSLRNWMLSEGYNEILLKYDMDYTTRYRKELKEWYKIREDAKVDYLKRSKEYWSKNSGIPIDIVDEKKDNLIDLITNTLNKND
jgi:hypothetical protein